MSLIDLDKIIKTYGLLVVPYGRSGSGKTRSLLNLFKTRGRLFCNEPRGLESLRSAGLREGDIKICLSQTEMYDGVADAAATPGIQWIAVDSLSRYYDDAMSEYCHKNSIPSDKISQKVWGAVSSIFMNFWEKLLLCTHAGINVIATCHEKEESDRDAEVSKVWFGPRLPGQLPEKILPQCAIVLRCFKVEINGQPHYRMHIPDGNSYGKDWTGQVTKPIDNDVTLLLGGFTQIATPANVTESSPGETTQSESTQPPSTSTDPEEFSSDTAPKFVRIHNGKENTPEGELKATQRDLMYLQQLCKEAGGDTGLLKTVIREHCGIKFLKDIKIKHMSTITKVLTKCIDEKDANQVFGEQEGRENAS